MEKTKTGKIFTIIICVALIVAVLIESKVSSKEKKTASPKEIVNVQEITTEATINDTEEELIVEDSFEDDDVEKVDEQMESMYEKVMDSEIEVKSDNEVEYDEYTYKLLHAEDLYEKELPSGVYTNIMQEIQNYLNDRYLVDVSVIKKVVILESSIKIDKDKNLLLFGIRLDKGSTADYAYVTVDLDTYEYLIYDVEV